MAEKLATLYKYVPLQYVTDILDNHRLYLNDGKSFNDPFEVTVTDRISGQLSYIKGLHILSLTNSYQNKLIWSHYTDSHKGVCLTVKIPGRLVYPICYTTRRVFSDSDVDQLIAKSVKWRKRNLEKPFSSLSYNKKIAYIKDKKWLYENEYRIIFDKDEEAGLIQEKGKWYMSVKITNVYLGVNFERNAPELKNAIISACQRNRVKVTQMILSDLDYSVKAERS